MTRLTGRDRDIELIHSFVDQATVRGGALLLSGDAGVGKTALLDVAASQATATGSLDGDATATRQILEQLDGPTVLVGHSYGGAVITEAGTHPAVSALVYVAAFVPDTGEALGELIGRYPGSEIQAALTQVPYPAADGTTGTDLYLQADKFRSVFAADLPESTTKIMAATQRPFSASSFTDRTEAAAWHTIPSWGLVASDDKAIPAALERYEYQRAGSHTVEVAASHVAMISHPDVVTGLIVDAANATT